MFAPSIHAKITLLKIIPKAILHRSKMVARRRATQGKMHCNSSVRVMII